MERFWWIRPLIFLVFTGFMIWAGYWVISHAFATTTYVGTDIKFTTGTSKHLLVESNDSTVTAASCQYFLLRQETGEPIYGSKTDVPLGVDCSSYYSSGPAKPVKGGYWIIEDGSPELKFNSAVSMRVQEVWNFEDSSFLTFLVVILGIMIWFVIGFGLILAVWS